MIEREYKALMDGETVPRSWLVAQLPGTRDCPGVTEILAALRQSDLDLEDARPAHQRTVPDARWELEVTLKREVLDEEISQELSLWVVPTEVLDDYHFDWAHSADGEIDQARESRWSLSLASDFGPTPLEDFHLQLKVLLAAAPDAAVFFDVTACRAHGAEWVREAAFTPVPPPPHTLFSIHAVCPDKKERGGAWLHTHGLVRCGIPELEMVDVPEDTMSSCGLLLNTVAAMCIEGGMPDAASPFAPGADMELLWLPWQKGLARLRRGRLGGLKDRDEYHSGPSAMLFAPRKKLFIRRLLCPAVYAPVLDENPLLYISNMETRRMSALAQERLDGFSDVFQRMAGQEDWMFLVKLGYQVDDAQDEGDREHLWFEVHHLSDENCEATLLNEPYRISNMHEGQRAEHDLELLTDWQIVCPLGRFSADTIIHLRRELEQPQTDEDSAVDQASN